jgi:hypothetical protein
MSKHVPLSGLGGLVSGPSSMLVPSFLSRNSSIAARHGHKPLLKHISGLPYQVIVHTAIEHNYSAGYCTPIDTSQYGKHNTDR